MISAFAKGAQVLDDKRYLTAAQRAADFILTHMYDASSGMLLRRFRDGDAAIPGFLDDYAFLIAALLDLYESDFDPSRIEAALALASEMRELFEDPAGGGFFSTASGDSNLVLRMKDDYDGAEPSGNSIALLDLMRLAHLTDRMELRQASERTLRALEPKIAAQPVAIPQALVALDYWTAARREVVIAGSRESAQPLLRALRERFLPNAVTLLLDSQTTHNRIAQFFPAASAMRELNGRPAAYVCRNYACQLPTSDVSKFTELLQ
jgi:uncharacterized protein YyaL (SSP411 family)